jgi:DNA-binding transcriptional LysR family regulator
MRKPLKWITLIHYGTIMEIDPGDLLLFARIVECGSFSLAAQRVQLPKSTVSRRIALLEAKLGERLLLRTTRKLVLTEFGASLLEHARRVAEETAQAGALAQHRQGEPSGLLRVSMPADFASQTMGLLLARFMRAIRPFRWSWTCRRAGSIWWREFRSGHPHGQSAGRRRWRARDHLQFAGAVCRAQYAACAACPSIRTTVQA